MKHNFQIMNDSNLKGDKYFPDWDVLRAQASETAEVEAIDKAEAFFEEAPEFAGFAFNMVYVMKQACGHYEVFQHHVHSRSEAGEWLDMIAEESKTRKCTRCICNW